MSADLMRRFLDIVEGSNELEILLAEPSRQVLSESALTEGWIADRINAAVAKLQGRFGEPSPQLLAKAATKAQSLYQDDPAVSQVLARASALGRSPALLAAMVGICGAMIALAPNPAAAQQAAHNIDKVLSLQDVTAIADTLQQYGIKCGTQNTRKAGLPLGLTQVQVKAAQCLKAIADYTFTEGANLSSSRTMLNTIAIEGGIERNGSRFEETVTLKTKDGGLTIAEYTTVYVVEDGVPSISHEADIGIRSDLQQAFLDLSEQQQDAIGTYIRQNSQMDEAAGGMPIIDALLKAKARDICLLVAYAAMRDGKVASRVSMGPKGIRVA